MTRGAPETGIQMAQSHLAPLPAPTLATEYMQPPYPYKPPRNRTPVALVVAIIVAGGLIAGAVLLAGGKNATPAPTTVASPTAPVAASAADSGTCRAWTDAKRDLDTVPLMPNGWETDPNRNVYIDNQANLLNPILNKLEKAITPSPDYVASAAHSFIQRQRDAIAAARNGTYASALTDQISTAYDKLDALCAR
ncbi:hypothetical protein [Mycobacteroides abscessus]|uniref:hypothetical protein n=1 Tax=Mycobacteroides abscessus TaxID=36809 RepID=UPI00104247C5|nr:hypothetical protein [Mycobacteroides abscessus]